MKLHKQPAGAEVEDVLSSLGAEAGGQMAFASIGIDAGNRTSHKKEHAECWLAAFIHEAAGNVQHRTDDEDDHVQGTTSG